MRNVKITPDYIKYAEGSCLIEIGNTKVICTANVEDGVPPFMKGQGRGWVTAEYGMLPGSCQKRVPREATKGRKEGRTHEIQRLLGRAMRCVTDLSLFGEKTMWIDCDVIQADGGTRCASITGGFVALCLAFENMMKKGMLKKNPVKNHIAAVSAGIVDDKIYLDLTYEEDSRAQVDGNIVMTDSGEFVEVQFTAEGKAMGSGELDEVLEVAQKGIKSLIKKEKDVLKGEQ
jgi:ribonuclease PH